MSLLVVIPTRSRPVQCARLIESFEKTTDDADLCFIIDHDDDSYAKMDWKNHVYAVIEPRGTMVQKLNHAVMSSIDEYDHFVWYADDNEFITPHWDTLMLEKLKEMGGSGWVYSNDKRRSDIPETWLASKDVIQSIGWYANPVLSQYYVADSLSIIGKRTGLLRYCKDVVVEHHHYDVDPTVVHDETYVTAEQNFGPRDLQNFRAWSSDQKLSTLVAKLRREFNPDVDWLKTRI